MHAIIRTGGKQYRVREGDSLNSERLLDDNQNPRALGEIVVFSEVLAVGDGGSIKVGRPHVAGATVSATVIAQARARRSSSSRFVAARTASVGAVTVSISPAFVSPASLVDLPLRSSSWHIKKVKVHRATAAIPAVNAAA